MSGHTVRWTTALPSRGPSQKRSTGSAAAAPAEPTSATAIITVAAIVLFNIMTLAFPWVASIFDGAPTDPFRHPETRVRRR